MSICYGRHAPGIGAVMAGYRWIRRDGARPVSTEAGTDMKDVSAGHLSGKPDGAAAF